MSGIVTQLEHTRDFRRASQASMKDTFINGPSLFTSAVSLEDIHSDLEEFREMHGHLMACEVAFSLYEEAKTSGPNKAKNLSASQAYQDLMALFIASNIGESLHEREFELTQNEVDDIKYIFEIIRMDYGQADDHLDQAMRLEIFELSVRFSHHIQRQYKGVFAPEAKIA